MGIDFEELLARKRPATAEVSISLDSDLTDALATARAAFEVARTVALDHPDQRSSQVALEEAEVALDEAEEAAAGCIVTFRFEGLSGPDWDALVDEHPATTAQTDRARKAKEPAPVWNEETFEPALIAATCIDPEMTYEQVQMLFKSPGWNKAETEGLFMAAHNASRRRRVPQLGKGSGRTPS